jgi:hemoglobin/transferrin/lactoferrin receptor protein
MNPEYVITGGNLQTSPSNQKLLWPQKTVHDESWSVNAGVRYAITPSCDVSMFVGTAFRSPSLEERYQFIDLGNLVRIGDPGLQPERSLCLNASVGLHPEGLMIRSDVFLNRLSNLIVEIPGTFEGRSAYVKSNIGSARLYGLEVSSELALTSYVVVTPSISYVRGEDTRNHTDLPQIPPFNSRVEVRACYETVGTLDISGSFVAPQNALAPGELRTPGYAVFDMDATSVPLNIWPVSVTVRCGVQNVFNRSFRNHLSTLRGLVRSEPGRNFQFSLTVGL